MDVVKVIEVIGTSRDGWEDAAQKAVTETSATVKNITGVEVVAQTAKVRQNQITKYRSDVKLAFVYDRTMKE